MKKHIKEPKVKKKSTSFFWALHFRSKLMLAFPVFMALLSVFAFSRKLLVTGNADFLLIQNLIIFTLIFFILFMYVKHRDNKIEIEKYKK